MIEDAVRAHLPAYQKLRASLVSIAGVSANAFPASEVRRSASAVAETLIEHGMTNVRLLVTTTIHGGPSWWEADPSHPIFTAARRALSKGFGTDVVMAGSGGSIGFVKPFADLLPDVPPLLTGVQDPHSNAHSENESLHLGDWEKAMRSGAYLFHELADFR